MGLNLTQKKVIACFIGSEDFRAALSNNPHKALYDWEFCPQALGEGFLRRLETMDPEAAAAAVADAYSAGSPTGC